MFIDFIIFNRCCFLWGLLLVIFQYSLLFNDFKFQIFLSNSLCNLIFSCLIIFFYSLLDLTKLLLFNSVLFLLKLFLFFRYTILLFLHALLNHFSFVSCFTLLEDNFLLLGKPVAFRCFLALFFPDVINFMDNFIYIMIISIV